MVNRRSDISRRWTQDGAASGGCFLAGLGAEARIGRQVAAVTNDAAAAAAAVGKVFLPRRRRRRHFVAEAS